MAIRTIQPTNSTVNNISGLAGYNALQSNQPPTQGSDPYAGVALAQPPPTQSAGNTLTFTSQGINENPSSAAQIAANQTPAGSGVESVTGGNLPAEGVYSDGSTVQYDPYSPPINGSDQDIQRWFDQFTKGTRDYANAEDSLNWQYGTGKYASGGGLMWDSATNSYVQDPNAVQSGPGSDLGEISQTGSDSFKVGAADSAGGSGVDLASDMQGLADQFAQSSKAADERFDALSKQFNAQVESAAAQQQQMMTMMMGLMNPRRDEDEGRSSFTYNALGGK